jgi:hypothetical protein
MIHLSPCYFMVSDLTCVRNMDYLTNGPLAEWAMTSLKRIIGAGSFFMQDSSRYWRLETGKAASRYTAKLLPSATIYSFISPPVPV